MPNVALDEFDRRILAELARNARASNLELEGEVKLSHSAISRRIARLEAAGVIRGYTARIDQTAIGLTVRAFVAVTRDPALSAKDLAETLGRVEGVAASFVVTGEQDVFLDIRAPDLQAFADVMLNKVQATKGVATTRSIFVMAEFPS
jgi:DNA-binding Lrp family transcriptional regulator